MKKLLFIILLFPFVAKSQYYIKAITVPGGDTLWTNSANDSVFTGNTGSLTFAYKPPFKFSAFQSTLSVGTNLSTSPLTVTNFNNTFPSPQTGTILHMVSNGVTNGRISFDTYNSTNTNGSIYQGRRAGGTALAPTAVLADYTLVALGGDGYGDDSYTNVSLGGIALKSLGTMTNTSKPTYLSFYTTPTASTTFAERMRIKSDGTVQILGLGAGIPVTDASGNISVITGTASQVLRRNAGNTAYEFGTITSGVAWGAITGTLSDQSDLQTALNGKQALATNLTSIGALANGSGFLKNNGSGTFTYENPAGSGTVTDVSVVSANGFAGSVATSTSTPAITLTTTITGLLKGNGTAISAATAGTDYVAPTGIGMPVYAQVTGSNATTTGQALTDITGLSIALTTNAVYEFEAVMTGSTSAVTTGTGYGVQYSAAGAAIEAHIIASSTSTATKTLRISALNTSAQAFLTSSAQTGGILIKGRITTGANSGNLTIQHLKVTSGTSTIFIGSFLKVIRIS